MSSAKAEALSELIARELADETPPTVLIQPCGIGTAGTPVGSLARWQVLPHDSQLRGALALAGM